MQNHHAIISEAYRFTGRLDDYDAGCDPDFDAEPEDLEPEFAELRSHFDHP